MRSILGVLLAAIVAAALTLLVGPMLVAKMASKPATPVKAGGPPAPGMVYHYGSYTFALTDKPCPFPELAEELESDGIPPARVGIATSGDQSISRCWVADMGKDVMTLGPDGGGTLPGNRFGREP